MTFKTRFAGVVLLAICAATVSPAHAVVYQIDGTVVPVGNALQGFLNPIEGTPPCPTCIDAVVDAATVPEIFLPDIFSVVRFEDIAEGAGFENSFGWYNVDDPNTLYKVFECADEPGAVVTVDFAAEAAAGNYNGGFIGFYIITPEDRDTIGCPQNCGDIVPASCFGHIYYTERALNNDGDFVHSLSYVSKLVADRFYFGFEDLFRGGDNDFEDMLVQVEGLIPPCVPTPEICDGVDNDCDGMCDEGPTADSGGSCGVSGVGECALGTLDCDNPMMACTGTPPGFICIGNIDPAPFEICDGLDNDCDGTPDNSPIDIGTPCGSAVGECTPGAEDCIMGALVCVPGAGPTAEACDGLDNDCDGTCDNLPVVGSGALCGVSAMGLCQLGTLQCNNPGFVCGGGNTLECVGNIDPVPEVCDGLDNDCNGVADNNPTDPLIGTLCGSTVGECTQGTFQCDLMTGALACVGGTGSTPELCDGLDNDCDGTCDDLPVVGAGGACGITDVGLCQLGTLQCDNPAFVCGGGNTLVCQGNIDPAPELCDGFDNDCDGTPDNNLADPAIGTPCGNTTGECTAGTFQCNLLTGALECVGGQGPVPEICDGLDNDCDGSCDELPVAGTGASCGVTDVGLCQFGVLQCDNTTLACGMPQGLVCVGNINPVPELCDGFDNDCDGTADNNLADPAIGTACGNTTGECTAGSFQCNLLTGALECVGGQGPVPEICDGLDNDCDGSCDELPVAGGGASCGVTDVGLCQFGVLQCDNTTLACGMPQGLVCVGNIDPVPELCDGFDNDCDGPVDNGPVDVGGVCGSDVGTCTFGAYDCDLTTGTLVCVGGQGPVPEICDGLDNDCDTVNDNNPTDVGLPCGSSTGECIPGNTICSAMGIPTCSGGMGSMPELCDNLDNDCDGVVDNNPTDVGAPCGTAVGECTPGTEVCGAGGVPTCIGGNPPSPELCDGLDNDCNTFTDDMPVDEGGPCGTDTGECELGVNICMDLGMGAMLVCTGGVGATPELCDGLDNDCDGAIDDGNPEGGGPCGDVGVCDGTDPVCPCIPGTEVCLNSMLVCVGGQGPEPEICDGIDNDCNGTVDDGAMCPSPTLCIDGGCREPCAALEFACPGGQTCVDGFCVPDLCDGLVCAEGEVCIANECQDPCADVTCMDGFRCQSGFCVEDNCYVIGCGTDEICWDGECVVHPCNGVDCGDGQVCREGACVDGCIDVVCAAPNHCVDGECVDDPCYDITCDKGQMCVDGSCVDDLCASVVCSGGRTCEDGACVDDVCNATVCPGDSVCRGGQCIPPMTASRSIFVGGGPNACGCRVGAVDDSGTHGGVALVFVLFFGLFVLRRRPHRRRSLPVVAAITLVVATAVALGGCTVDPYTFEGVGQTDSGTMPPPCTPTNFSVEICDEVDNDCDGTVDEGFDFQTDPVNCGECDNACALPGAITQCVAGMCETIACAVGFHDLDGDPTNGCEYECLETNGGVEDCDLVDNDCDGDVDEDTDFMGDPDNCGFCGVECVVPNAAATCIGSICVPGLCDPDFYEIDMDPTNGCEYFCLETNGGVETCDLVDNDCDGVADDGIDTLTDPTNCGSCGRVCMFDEATALCAGGTCALGPCNMGHLNLDMIDANGCEYACTATGPELCNGVDDDCNGFVDDSPVDEGSLCGNGTGECVQGTEVCSGGVLVCTGELGPYIESCNGLDDDCDGTDDNNLTGLGAPCGTNVGECSVGAIDCVTGALTCVGETPPGTETCNGLDDDCDGFVDNGVMGLGGPCGSAVGECVEGTEQCVGGAITCVGGIGPSPEICDGLDNDCDTVDDNGVVLGGPCGSNTGNCTLGAEACVMGAVTCVGGTGPAPETCDGFDEDCDGVPDNGVMGLGGPCGNGMGECVQGTEQCVGGAITCVGGIGSSPEVCDGLDNDCDGVDDNGVVLGAPCGSNTGNCTFGAEACVMGAVTCVGGTPPAPETCDGFDEDCDGIIDNGVMGLGGPCGNGMGECVQGTEQCVGGSVMCVGGLGPSPEICDGLDNDCDGMDDNGVVLGAPCGSNTGNCTFGAEACVMGAVTCVGGTPPAPETCDGFDEDCDGVVDNGAPGFGGPCGDGTGECTEGVWLCVAGAGTCVGGTGPLPEVCDGLDNDCNGMDDNGILGLGAPCGSNIGECSVGTTACGGFLGVICVGETLPVPEVFDCLDNNCDGVADNGVSAPSCGATDVGECEFGVLQCFPPSTIPVCVGEIVAATEVCDGLDNDCDTFGDPAACLTLPGTDTRIDTGSPTGRNSIQPAIDATGLNVYLAWLDHRGSNSRAEIYYRRSLDAGATWGSELRLDTSGTDAVQPLVGADLPFVYVPFLDFSGADRDVHINDSSNSGASFNGDYRIDGSPNNIDSLRTDLAFDGLGNVYVVYEDFRGGGTTRNIFLIRSNNNGASFQGEIRVNTSPGMGSAFATEPRLAITPSGRVVVTWRDLRSGASDIYVNYSDDLGVSMAGADIRIDTDAIGASASNRPRIAADDAGNLFIVWQDLRNGLTSDIYYNMSSDEGSTWLVADVQLDAPLLGADSFTPEVAAFGGFVNVVWQDFVGGNPDIYVSSSNDFGVSFTSPFRVDRDLPTPGISFAPVIAADGSGTVCVAWLDDRNGETDVYLNFALDDGFTFQPDDLRVDEGDAPGASESRELRMAMDGGGGCYMVWRDTRLNGIQSHIYFNAALP